MFAVGGAGKLVALEAKGSAAELRWEHDLVAEFEVPMPDWGIACSPLVLGDMVVVHTGGPTAVAAFDRQTGAVRWKVGANSPGYSSPVAANVGGIDTVFAFMGDALLAVRVTNAEVTDSFKWKTDFSGNIATPIVVDDYVFISSAYGMGCALLRAEKQGDGVKLVKVYERRGRAFQAHHATPVYKDKHLFGVDGQTGNGGLKCVEFITGTEVKGWDKTPSKDAKDVGQATVVLAGEHLLIQTANGSLMLVEANPKEFKPLGTVEKVLNGRNNWATPALVDGRIYVRDEQNVVCLDVRPVP